MVNTNGEQREPSLRSRSYHRLASYALHGRTKVDDGLSSTVETLGTGELLILSPELRGKRAEPLRECLQRIIRQNGFEIDDIDEVKDALVPTRDLIEHEATQQGMVKKLNPTAASQQGMGIDEFDYDTRDAFDRVDDPYFFSPAEICMLSHRVLYSIEVDAELATTVREWDSHRARHVVEGQGAVQSLLRAKIIEDIMPIHNAPFMTALVPKFGAFPCVDHIQQYYGDAVALYFAWMSFMCSWLALPGILGIATYAIHQVTGETVEDSHYAPFFSVAMIVWACLFVKFWQRQEAHLSVQWGSIWTTSRHWVRPGFTGTWRQSPVTGEQELYFPSWRRWPRYVVSSVVSGALLLCAFATMIASLNLQGYIQDAEDEFHIPALARHAAQGAIFNPLQPEVASMASTVQQFVMPLVPVIIHVATIFVLNQIIYRNVAEWLTSYENHQTEHAHRTSLIIKRILFEAFDCYIALLYLAFWQRDVLKVRAELKALFTADCARRVATEVVLPWLIQRLTAASRKSELDELKKRIGEKPSQMQALEDSLKDEYEDFDDYIEMAIQFGYVTLFAAAMPLAAAIACVYTFIEMRSDLVKLLFIERRPVAERVTTIGIWATVIQVQAWLAIATNSVLFAFSSDQVAELAPGLFRSASSLLPGSDTDPAKVLADGAGRWLVAVWAVVEHGLVLLALVLTATIPSVPESVTVAVERKRYLDEKQAHDQRQRDRIKFVQRARAEALREQAGQGR